jgi:DNA-binding beta-propeller fold protein YncE
MRPRAILLVIALTVCSITPASSFSSPLPLRPIADIPLSGNASRMDYASLDARAHLLFIAHMGANQVVAFDTLHRRVAATIDGTRTVRGVLVVPPLHRVYAAARGSESVAVIDESSLRIVARVDDAGDVDGLAFDPGTKRVFVSDEAGGNDTVIDASTNRAIAKIPLGGEAGNTQYDAGSGHIFVAVQTRNQLLEIDPQRLTVLARYDLPGCNHGHGVAIDAKQRRAYVACEGNNALVEFDLRSHRVIGKNSVGDGPDVLAIDPLLHRLYVASESGVVSIFDISGSGLRPLAQDLFAPHAHVVAVDPATHEVYFPLENVAGRPVLRIAAPI